MKLLAVFLATCLMPVATLVMSESRASASTGCVTSAAKIIDMPKLTLPQDAKLTAKSIAFEVDIGSDGRVRAMQMVQGSGDANVDLSLRQALQAASYAPPQTGCVAYSGGLHLSYGLSPDATAGPPEPAKLTSTCTPYVLAFLTPIARDRKRTGTAIVAVDLDASGSLSGTPALHKSTGSPVLDQEALRIAAAGHYNFLRGSPCAPQAFVYLLELTFQ